MRLQILICTLGYDGIMRFCQSSHPRIPGVEYLIAWQQPDNEISVPKQLLRDDIKIIISATRGLSRNRNIAINAASAPICLLGDDDIDYTEDGLRNITEAFDSIPELDVATFMHSGISAKSKHYPKEITDLSSLHRGYWPTSFEIAFRLESVKSRFRFNENMGIGTHPLICGEEDVLFADFRDAGLKMRFFPRIICSHDHPSTASRLKNSKESLMAKGAVFLRVYGLMAYPHIIWAAIREFISERFNPITFLTHTSAGIHYAHRNKIFR